MNRAVPGYISRSVAGSYDNEGIAIFALMVCHFFSPRLVFFNILIQFTYFLWIRSIKTGSMMWAAFCAISYFYMVCHICVAY